MAQTQVGTPTNLLVYKPKQQYTALCWQINVTQYVALAKLAFEVQVDVADTFNSVNLQVYTADNVEEYQNGTFFKSFVIKDPTLINASQTYYWRVRVTGDDYFSQWSDVAEQNITEYLGNLAYNQPIQVLVSGGNYITITKNHADEYVIVSEVGEKQVLTQEELIFVLSNVYDIEDTFYVYIGAMQFTVDQATWYTDTETAENLLPDNYVYTKIGATNIKKILEMYMRLIGAFKNEAIQVSNNINYKKVQDEDLYDRLGALLSYTRNTLEPMITYKYELLSLWQAYLHQGTVDAFNIFIKALYGTEPEIEILKDVRDTWRVYEDIELLSLDGSTSTITDFSAGDSFYDPTLNRIITAQADNDWTDALIELPDETATYMVPDIDGIEQAYYHYDGLSETLLEGRPTLDRFYLRQRYYDDQTGQETFTEKQGDIAYLYTKPYLAHNLVIRITNAFGVDVDRTVLLAILNELKPINMNIVLDLVSYEKYYWGQIYHYGQRGLYWGGYDPYMLGGDESGGGDTPSPVPVDTDCTFEIVNTQGAIVIINNVRQTQYRTQYGQVVSWLVMKAGYVTQSGTITMTKAIALVITLKPGNTYMLTVNAVPEGANVTINGITTNQLVLGYGETYTWQAELEGYLTQIGSGLLTEDRIIDIDLANPPVAQDCEITAQVLDADFGDADITASCTISWTVNGATTTGTTVTAQTGETVHWQVEKAGYLTQTGDYIVPINTTEHLLTVSFIRQTFTLTINPTPQDATVIINGQETRSLGLKYNTGYTYTVSATGYLPQTVTGTIVSNITIPVTLTEVGAYYSVLATSTADPDDIYEMGTYTIVASGTYSIKALAGKGIKGNGKGNGGTIELQIPLTQGQTIKAVAIFGGSLYPLSNEKGGGTGVGIYIDNTLVAVVGGGGAATSGYQARYYGGGGYIGGGTDASQDTGLSIDGTKTSYYHSDPRAAMGDGGKGYDSAPAYGGTGYLNTGYTSYVVSRVSGSNSGAATATGNTSTTASVKISYVL